MSPFREAPNVELGSLEVGVEVAAAKAFVALPRGGRLVVRRAPRFAPHAVGAIGSAGLLLVTIVALLAATTSWQPASISGFAFAIAMFFGGGACLATVLRVTDRVVLTGTRDGDAVGRAARAVVMRMALLGAMARRAPDGFGARRVRALRRSLAASRHPDVARWIPADLRGRCELLLARAITRHAGPHWASDFETHAEVRELLLDAAHHLRKPAPAEDDLATLARVPSPSRRRVEISAPIADEEPEGDELDAAPIQSLTMSMR